MFEIRMFVAYILSTIYLIFLASSFGNDKKIFLKTRSILALIVYIAICDILTLPTIAPIKLPVLLLAMALLYLFITKKTIVESIKFALAAMLFNFVAEMLFAGIAVLIFKIDFTKFSYHDNLYIISNIVIYTIAILLSQTKAIIKYFKERTKTERLASVMLIGVVFSVLMGLIAQKTQYITKDIDIIINVMLALVGSILILYLLRLNNERNKLSNEYDILFKNIERYEDELSKSRKVLHEHKNQLITIRGLADNENIELNQYIESVIGDLKKQDIKMIKGLENIPSGMIKSLLYYKLIDIEKNKISLEIITDAAKSKKYNQAFKEKIEKMNMNMRKNIMKVVGVALDNAIEAATKSRDKFIIFEFKNDANQCTVIISNTFDGEINGSKLGQTGYSTKGNKRGYGLSLIRDITNKNQNITFEHSVINEMFVAKIKIKI